MIWGISCLQFCEKSADHKEGNTCSEVPIERTNRFQKLHAQTLQIHSIFQQDSFNFKRSGGHLKFSYAVTPAVVFGVPKLIPPPGDPNAGNTDAVVVRDEPPIPPNAVEEGVPKENPDDGAAVDVPREKDGAAEAIVVVGVSAMITGSLL